MQLAVVVAHEATSDIEPEAAAGARRRDPAVEDPFPTPRGDTRTAVLDAELANGTLVFDVAAFVILASIVAHGLTDTVGARWIERRMADR